MDRETSLSENSLHDSSSSSDPAFALLAVHASQFPENVRRDLLESLRTRRINHKFHYDSVKQAQRWLELHKAYSPFVTDPECASIYDRAFEAVAEELEGASVHLIGLGCGGGQKESRLLRLLAGSGKELFYTACDVSSALVLMAWKAAIELIPKENCFPLVCDLATAGKLEPVVIERPGVVFAPRIITFFGMLPNFESQSILPRLAELIRPGDHLLVSANLAPGPDYGEGVKQILPLYDNPLTREWLITILLDLGIKREDGEMQFVVEGDEVTGLKRIAVYFIFQQESRIEIGSELFRFEKGDSIRLFFSCRHTPQLLDSLLNPLGLTIIDHWINSSGEEGVFLVKRES